MTEVETAESTDDRPRSRTKLWLWCATIVVVVSAAVAVPLAFVLHDEGYGPLEAGEASGVGGPGVHRSHTDGFGDYDLGDGPAYYFSLLDNTGTHAVRVTGILRDAAVADGRWAPAPRQGDFRFSSVQWRQFPATVPANGTIQVRVTVRRPETCAGFHDGAHEMYTGDYVVGWRSRRSLHEFPFDPVAGARLQLC